MASGWPRNVDPAFQFPGSYWTDIDGTSPHVQYFHRVRANSAGPGDWGPWMVTGPGDYDVE
jgi:hypothetical protein